MNIGCFLVDIVFFIILCAVYLVALALTGICYIIAIPFYAVSSILFSATGSSEMISNMWTVPFSSFVAMKVLFCNSLDKIDIFAKHEEQSSNSSSSKKIIGFHPKKPEETKNDDQ